MEDEDHESLENLANLKNGNAILDVIQNRYNAGRIYTLVGSSLLAFNPNRQLEIYDIPTVDQYLNGGPFSDRAHVFSIACSALGSIQNGSKAEAILLSGNSGSGKTTNAFHLMRFLTTEARSKKINCDHINAVEVILNRLASAKTLKNENSTRCGYSVQFLYKSGILQGFKVDSVLPLELSRLILQRNGEKSFSVFYQLCAGLSYDEREKFGINDAKQYFYLNQGRNNSSTQIEADLFREFNSALKTIGFSDHQRGLIYKLLSSILHLGNIYFRTSMISDGSEVVELANEAELKWVAHLLEIDVDDLKQLFLTQAEPVKPENEYEEPPRPKLVPISSVDKALDIRDSFAKTLYKELFKWVLNHISMFFEAPQYDGQISIIDAYGFERYTFNGFEEFCVNVINEQLHNVFIQKVFKSFQRDYEDEGIACDYRMPSHLDNERVVGMLSYRPCGLVPLLNDECRFPKGSDQAFFQRASINHLDKSIFAKPRTKDRFEFGIKHFAGMTYYCVDGFLQKNQWTEIGAVKELLSQSNDPAIAYMNQKSGEVADKKIYISDEFVKAVDILSEKLLKERIQFVRCIRVNNDRSRSVFDPELVGKQMKALEIQENYRMSHFGFSCKYSFEEFIKRYRCLLPIEVISYDKPQRIVTDILTGQGSKFDSDYAVGVHSVFMKERLIKQLDTAKHALRDSSALVIQRNLRMHQARKAFKKKKAAAIKLQAAVRGWSARRETENLKREEIEKIELPLLPPPPPPPLAEEEIIFPTATINFFEIPEEVAKITEKKVEVGKVKTITTYLPFELQLEKPEVESMMIEEFAELYLKNHILEARREPVLTPFLPKDTEEDFQLSLVLFKLILKYMNDSTLRAGQRSLLAKYIMQQGIENLNQRDEIYVQLCNQTYNNKNPESTRSAWNLISMAVNSFPPGILVFPMLVDYFEKQPEPLSTILLEGLLRPLRHADTHKNRLFAPTVLEQLSLNRRQPTILQISLPGGDSVDVEVDAWTTAEEIVDRVLRLRGLTDADGWGIEIENSEINGIVSGQNFIFDALSQFEEPRARVDQSPFVNFKTFAKSDPRNSADPEGTDGKPDIDTESLKKSISILKSNSKPRMTPEEYANMSVATRIRNMKIPGNNGDVNRFLDEVFDQVLPPNEEITPAALASTIKGGISHEIYYHRPESSDHYIPHRQQRQLPRFYDNYNRRVPSGLSSINLSDGGRDSRFSSNPPSRQLYSPPFRTSYQRRSSSMSPENEQASRMHTNGNVNLDDYYENAPGTRPSTTTRRDSSPRMRTPSNGYEQSADSSYFDNSLPTSNIRQIIRRFESPVAERRARALSSRSKSTPREFSTYNSDVPHPAPAPDYEQEEIVDVRSPRQFRSPDYPRSVSSTPRLPRTSPGRFPMINPEGDPRSAREEAARKLRRNAEEVPPFVFREELKSPMTLDSRQESPLLSRNGTSAYSKPPIPQPPISRSRSGTANGFHNGVSNGNGMMSNGKSNGVQKTRSGGYWAYDGEVDQGNAYMSHPADIPELSAAPSRNSPLVSAASRNGYPTSAASRNSPFASVASRNDPLASATSVTSIKSGATSGSSPATGYVNEPWKLTIRREVFYPGEKLDDIDSIDLVFSQIITDCRKSNPHRIRQFERDRINYILNKYQVPVELLDRVNEISVKIKNEIINEVRKWPLYFCRMYSVIKEQENGGLFMILAIGENGIRLMTRNVENSDDPMVPQGHFDFSDITDVIYEPTSTLKILTTTQTTKLTCKQAQQAAEFILRFLENTPKRKTFVTATVDYQTKESNLLSFRCGDIIQVVKENKQDKPPAAGKWLYGKIGNRFGWFPVEYVQPTTAESEYGSEIYTPSVANNNHALSPQFKSNTDILHRTTRGPENVYSNLEDQSTIYGVPRAERLTMAEFAMKHFRQPKSSDFGSLARGRRRKEWTWQEVTDKVKFSDKPISHSLIRLASPEADRAAVDMFACVMRYMSDLSMKRGQTITDCVYEILSICHNNSTLIDEAYCQVIKQTTSNKSPKTDSLLLGWRLFTILTAYFAASEVLQPYLLRHLRDIAEDPRRPFNGTASLCLMNYQQTLQYGGRKFILTAAEVEAITGGKNVKRQAYEFPGNQRRFISTKTITVAEEIIKELCSEMNVLSEAEQHEFALCYILEKDNTLRILSNDEYILDVTSELETRNEKFTFILTRTVWIHPLREDNKLYTDVLFFQLLPHYMAGLLTTLPKGLDSPLPAKTLDDAAILAALLYIASEASLDEITEETVTSLIPITVFERSRLSTTNWLSRIKHKLSVLPSTCTAEIARSEFLKFTEKWPLYGSSFYFVTKCKLPDKSFDKPILVVNKHGLKILNPQSMDVVWNCPLSEIRSSRKYSVNNSGHVDVHVAPDVNSPTQIALTVETDSGSEICRIIGQYVYLSRHKPSLVVNTRGDR